jgi:hypothetical protein
MIHLEALISEYLEWSGFFIRRNTKVGRLNHGGWDPLLRTIQMTHVGYCRAIQQSVQPDRRTSLFGKGEDCEKAGQTHG